MNPRSNPINSISSGTNFTINLFFWLYVAACILPMILIISVSFTDERTILLDGYRFIPESFSTTAYQFLLSDWGKIVRAYGVSIFVTIVGTVGGVILMAMFAYPISRPDFPHRNFFAFFMFFTLLFNGGLVPTYLVYVQLLGLKDSVWALILPYTIQAFFVLIMRTFFAQLPSSIIESAKIDGASEFRIFFKIVLPLSLPVLATVAMFMTLLYWNDWFLSLIYITDDNMVTLQYLMYKTMLNIQYLATNVQAQQGIAQAGGIIELPTESVRMAMAVVGIGPIFLAYPFFQRYFVKGLTVGAVKG